MNQNVRLRALGSPPHADFQDTLPLLISDIQGIEQIGRATRLNAEADRLLSSRELRNHPTLRYLEFVRKHLSASAVTLYIQGYEPSTLRVLMGDGQPLTTVVRNRALLDQHSVAGELRTFIADPHWLRDDYETGPDGRHPSIIASSCLTWHDLPLLILYEFAHGVGPDDVKVAHIASREIGHLLRAEELRNRYACLEAINRTQRLLPDEKNVYWEICQELKAYFLQQAACILTASSADALTFEKYYVHHQRKGFEAFHAPIGFSRYAIEHRKALIVTSIHDRGGMPVGECLEYDLESFGKNAGTPTRIETFKSPKAIEHEKSMILLPFFTEGDSGAGGVVRVGSLEEINAFNIGHLRALRSFARAISSIFTTIVITKQLRADREDQKRQQRERAGIDQHAQTLFYYRHAALGIFHQVGNALNTLSLRLADGQIMALELGPQAGALNELLEQSLVNVNDGKRLIKSAKDRGKRLKPVVARCRLIADVVRPAIEQAQRMLKDATWTIRRSLTSEDYWVVVDEELLRESIFNILSNAIKAVKDSREAGRPGVFVAVRPSSEGTQLRIEISDTGVGMSHEVASRLFEPFFTTRGAEGSGLGLYFARQLIDQIGGAIELVRTLPGKGSTFSITVPAAGDSK